MTILVNLLAGPGAGKSSLMHETIALCKWRGIVAEGAFEYAKDVVWEGRIGLLSNPLYIFAKQEKRIRQLWGKVDVVITDSPLLLSVVYAEGSDKEGMARLVEEATSRYQPTLNYYVVRQKPYSQAGRIQTEQEARALDDVVARVLNHTPYKSVVGREGEGQVILRDIQAALRKATIQQLYEVEQ
ncbi:MAG: AAA family ATPase [Dehalococcoidia bacterium]|nr:AAA family ATPase [Dehalococcoidia bacterium]